MAKKKHLSLDAVVGDDVMTPTKTSIKPTGSPVGQHLAQAHQKAKDTIDNLTRTLEAERREREEEQARLKAEIERLESSGASSSLAESEIAQLQQKSEARELELTNKLSNAKKRMVELERALDERPTGDVIVVDPWRVRHSRLANRHPLSFSDQAFDDLVESLKRHGGNDLPVKLRRVSDDPDYDFEVVYGHRRHKASRVAGTKLYAIIEDISDSRMSELMHLENQRENLSAFEEALAFKAWLDQGIYRNATELARAINKSKGAVSQRMSITELPDVVFRALGDPRQLSLRSWRALCAMYSSDRRPVLLGRAEQLSEGFVEFKPASESEVMKIFRKLTEAAPSPTSKPEVRGFTLPSGTPLFSAKRTAKGYQIAFDSTGVAEDIQEAALEELERFLKERLT